MCIVHDQENAVTFTSAIHQLRREKKFHSDIHQQLPDRCCSCEGKEGLKMIDLAALRKICHDIQISWASKVHLPLTKNLNKLVLAKRHKSKSKQVFKDKINDEIKLYYTDRTPNFSSRREQRLDKCRSIRMTTAIWKEKCAIIDSPTYEINLFTGNVLPKENDLKNLLILPFSSISNVFERKRTLGLFIGKQGRHIRRLEGQYEIRINIVTDTSSGKLYRDVLEIMKTRYISNDSHIYNMYLIFTATDASEIRAEVYDEIEKLLRNKWDTISQSEQLSQRHRYRR